MNSVTPIRNGSGVRKSGKRSASTRTHPRFPVDGALDKFNFSMQEDDGASDHGEVGIEGEVRVGCPFHKHDPKAHQLSSCKGKGYLELAKLKYVCVQNQHSSPAWVLTHSRDHSKQAHGLSLERLNADFNFKTKDYISLGTLEEKWRLVYRRLFPKEAEDSIPLPSANEYRGQFDGLISGLVSVVGRRAMEEKAFQEGVLDFARTWVHERQSARSNSVDSAVDFMTNPSSATMHTPYHRPCLTRIPSKRPRMTRATAVKALGLPTKPAQISMRTHQRLQTPGHSNKSSTRTHIQPATTRNGTSDHSLCRLLLQMESRRWRTLRALVYHPPRSFSRTLVALITGTLHRMRMSVRLRRTATLSATTASLLTLVLNQETPLNGHHTFQIPF